jgi:hypothetical protein
MPTTVIARLKIAAAEANGRTRPTRAPRSSCVYRQLNHGRSGGEVRLAVIVTHCCECWGDRNGSFNHEHYSSSPSKTLPAAMGSSVRFADNPDRTKECWIERLNVNVTPRVAKAKEKPAG